MGLMSALVDQGRIVTRTATAEKVEGTTRYEPSVGPWFRCRLALEGFTEEDAENGRVRTEQDHELLYWRTANDGSAVLLDADDEIQIISNQEGDHIWKLTAKPLLIRKKIVMLGAGYVSVTRVRETAEPVA